MDDDFEEIKDEHDQERKKIAAEYQAIREAMLDLMFSWAGLRLPSLGLFHLEAKHGDGNPKGPS